MKSRFKRIRVILVVAISLSIPVCSAYVCYYTVAAADFLSPNLKLEAFDQEFLSSALENELKVPLIGNFWGGSYLITYFSGYSFHFLSHIPSPDQEILILRC